MKISELIAELQRKQETHGDIPCFALGGDEQFGEVLAVEIKKDGLFETCQIVPWAEWPLKE